MHVSSHQWYYDLAIGVCFEVVWVRESFTDESVVIDFAIDSEGNALITVGEWLSSRVDTNNRETLVGKHCVRLGISPPRSRLMFACIPVLLAT